jgi:hypothetical protein
MDKRIRVDIALVGVHEQRVYKEACVEVGSVSELHHIIYNMTYDLEKRAKGVMHRVRCSIPDGLSLAGFSEYMERIECRAFPL